MSKTIKFIDIATIALTADVVSMVDYLGTPDGRVALERGLNDMMQRRLSRVPTLATIQF